ncbi:MAG TPA: endonuclease/exonuclease/phosphatase family protein [Longimicrobiaceae bacterium]|nr:endonuclease/exonuclease/phosphatase family protein [Longimicrobiaceae bacterium]
MLDALRWLLLAAGALMVGGTLLGFSRSPRWFIRLWDFPRVQIAVVATVSGALYAAFFFLGSAIEWVWLAAVGLCVGWQAYRIFPYTPLARRQVKRSGRLPHDRDSRGRRFRLLISNVRMENRATERLLRVIRENDPDLVLAVETDERWARAFDSLASVYPHAVRHPRGNYYGMVLLSKLPLVDPRVEFLVQDDIPSIHTGVELPGGDRIFLHGLHPRPPEPVRGQDSTPRDAELVIVGRRIGEGERRPTVVAGDLNDVAWSPVSELFLRLSGLLDPRVGRGMFNSFNANNPFFRYPLDHVFHSDDFRLVSLRRLPHIGSDHFPLLIELSYEPEGEAGQPEPGKRPGDEEEAREKLVEQAEAARTGDDRPSRE